MEYVRSKINTFDIKKKTGTFNSRVKKENAFNGADGKL